MSQTLSPPTGNPYAGEAHSMQSGIEVRGVSRAWARSVDRTLQEVLPGSPELRHVMIEVPKADRSVRRLFHSDDGVHWQQVVPAEISGSLRLDLRAIARGARELDGDPVFPSDLSFRNLRLREQAGLIVQPQATSRRGAQRTSYDSLADWVEQRARVIRDEVGDIYVNGATSEEHAEGRRQSRVTIERFIDKLRMDLRQEMGEPQLPTLDGKLTNALHYEAAVQDIAIQRRYPFVTRTSDIRYAIGNRLPKDRRVQIAKGFWADAAGLPRSTRFDRVYGMILKSAEGHPVYGDNDYRRLLSLLADALKDGFEIARIGGLLYVHGSGRWRPIREDSTKLGEASWKDGVIISRNYGRLIVPPHRRDGELIPGYTRNGPGEGASLPRSTALRMLCVERPISKTDLAWLHAYHAWQMAQEPK